MPFAPVVLEEDMKDLFLDWDINDKTSQYMTSTYNLNLDYQHLISAVVHVDQTARPQSVNEKNYPYPFVLTCFICFWTK